MYLPVNCSTLQLHDAGWSCLLGHRRSGRWLLVTAGWHLLETGMTLAAVLPQGYQPETNVPRCLLPSCLYVVVLLSVSLSNETTERLVQGFFAFSSKRAMRAVHRSRSPPFSPREQALSEVAHDERIVAVSATRQRPNDKRCELSSKSTRRCQCASAKKAAQD